ncbi:metallophosphoesterase [Cryobacterium levicorallinum]|nr:metallophosphoesterase [Cryobacterium levicorallinum]SFH76293.1 Calcineurin-like phosphoesterase [Cryobacterium levicorallinum]
MASIINSGSARAWDSRAPQNSPLSSARRIGLLGDTHGDLEHVLIVSRTLHARGIRTLVVLGDFGFIWPGYNWDNGLDKLSRRLAVKTQTLYFVDGNHEDFTRLYQFPLAKDGLRWLRPNIAHIPRGWRTTLASGKTLAALGGANSVDVAHRSEGSSWWPDESVTEADLASVGHQHADVLIGHDAPLNVPSLDTWLAETNRWWPEAGIQYSASGRAMFHRGFLQVRPELYVGGHYHRHFDDTIDYDGDIPFTSRVVLLDKNGSEHAISQAILDTETLHLEYFDRNDQTVSGENKIRNGPQLDGTADDAAFLGET